MHEDLVNTTTKIIKDLMRYYERQIKSLGEPEIYLLNRRSLANFYSAVAVDAGESLFGGAFKLIGVTIFLLATSEKRNIPQVFILYNGEHLRSESSREWIISQISDWIDENDFLREFIEDVGWTDFKREDAHIIPNSVFNNSSECVAFFRELIEWAKLYSIGKEFLKLRSSPIYEKTEAVLLRDGVLRFNNTGEYHSTSSWQSQLVYGGCSKISGQLG